MRDIEALESIEELDIYMLNNLNEKNTLKNVNDIGARMGLLQLEKIIQSTEVKELIKKRAEILHNAILIASLRKNSNSNLAQATAYFEYVDKTKMTFENGIRNTDEAINIIENSLKTRNVPDKYVINYIIAQSGANNLTPKQANRFNELVPLINGIAKIEQDIRKTKKVKEVKEDEKRQSKMPENIMTSQNTPQNISLVVRKEKHPILRKIIDFLTGKNKNTNIENQQISENYKKTIKAKPINSSIANRKSFREEQVVVSDLHGDIDKWNTIKEAMRKNPKLKVIMLGDAMDRGEYGPEILLQIKEFSDLEKIEYLPGNHDIFAYNYLKAGKQTGAYQLAKIHLEHNGGKETMNKLDYFDQLMNEELIKGNIKNKVTKEEFTNWLGNQPIQKKVETKETVYALSHAIFDEKLYNYDKNFNLEKALSIEKTGKKDSEVYRRFLNCMWYREDDNRTHYSDISWPNNCAVIVGHTPQNNVNIQYCFQGDPKKAVVYVDTGKGNFEVYSLTENKIKKFEERFPSAIR